MFSPPQPPPAPNPYEVARTQQMANISVGIASNVLQNADEEGPQGTVTYTTSRTYTLVDPQYGSSGTAVGTTNREIPIFKRTVTLKTKAQQVFDQQQDLAIDLNDLAAAQIGGLQTHLSVPFSLASLPSSSGPPAAPVIDTAVSTARAFTTSIGGSNYESARQTVVDALKARLDFQFDIDRSSLIVRLNNQGLFAGMQAYNREIQLFDQRVNDGYLQAELRGGEEHTRLFGIERQSAEFYNEVAQKEITRSILIMDFKNKAALQVYQILHEIADFINTFRERRLQELLQERQQPLNEVVALKNGGQMSLPQFSPFKGSAVANTPIGQYVYQSAGLEMQAFQMKAQQQQALMGGIAGIAGGVLALGTGGGTTVGGNLLSRMMPQ